MEQYISYPEEIHELNDTIIKDGKISIKYRVAVVHNDGMHNISQVIEDGIMDGSQVFFDEDNRLCPLMDDTELFLGVNENISTLLRASRDDDYYIITLYRHRTEEDKKNYVDEYSDSLIISQQYTESIGEYARRILRRYYEDGDIEDEDDLQDAKEVLGITDDKE